MDNLKRTAENVDRMLDSYKDSNNFALRLYGPTVHLMPPPFWAFRERRRERDLQRRLKAFDLPPIDQDFRWRWYSQYQLFEDAGGYIRRRWVCSYGFTLQEYKQFLAARIAAQGALATTATPDYAKVTIGAWDDRQAAKEPKP